jgi:hypothetical protein
MNLLPGTTLWDNPGGLKEVDFGLTNHEFYTTDLSYLIGSF